MQRIDGVKLVLMAACCGLLWGQRCDAAGANPAKPGQKKLPMVVMKQDRIDGRVFLLAEGKKEEPTVANLKVELRSADGSKLIHETKTGAKGEFALPNIAVAPYALIVGRLHLELQVQEAAVANGSRAIPKQIMIFLPHELVE
jgi:hypothetical protein